MGLSGTAGTVTISGGGVALFGNNTYTGDTIVVSGGSLSINNGNALGNGKLIINGGNLAQTFGAGSLSHNNSIVADTDFTYSSGIPATLNLGTGAVDLGALNTGGTTGNTNRTISVSTSTSTTGLTIGGVISDGSNGLTTGITKSGAGLLALGGASNYSGSTVVSAGTLQLTTGNNRLPTGTVLTVNAGTAAGVAGGRLDLNSRSQTVAGLSGAADLGAVGTIGNTSGTSATLTLSGSSSTTFDGSLVNAASGANLALVKSGTGTQTLAGTSSYGGGTTISGGILIANGGTATAAADASQTASMVARTFTLTGLTSTSGLVVGQRLSGTNIPSNAYITSIVSSTSVTISSATTNTSTASGVAISFAAYSGSALGTGAVSVGSSATLAGAGTVSGLVTTGGVTSSLEAGSAIGNVGTLTLAGGLNAAAGAKFAFQLGTSSDLISLGSSTFTGSTAANGLVFDFSDAGGLAANTAYTLLTFGTASGLDYSDLLANTLPGGYVLDSGFGTGGFQINSGNLQVQFSAVPEPSTVALLGMGAGALWMLRRGRRAVQV